ncbi:MAG: prohibitin family protein [Ignavibacteriaceae bacterium]|nr:prohibitin family protein [Ignavibacteriaceae bacterium]HMN24406.1 prohibitin family protein [Ignavibacteriaceae bacterium]HRN27136.1 prohibitin family protein [Ignavibacteriaceae bacterium]HRP91800.1 prohibitin family protein [Ignavibacteriaceae bacterium]HRQ55304.1 prohibitin family protein [Ignavibacteriaceae bacterium]
MLFIVAILATVIAFFVYKNAKKRFNKPESSFAIIGIVVALLVAVSQFVTVIPAGHTGVIDFLGMVSDNTLKPGVNLVNPMAKVEKMSIKTQELKELMSVPSKEGLSVDLEISLLFKLNSEKANEIYKTVGPNYAEIILTPQFRSVVRGVTARYEAKALYTASREKLAGEILTELEHLVGPRGIIVEQAPLRQIKLPERLTKSIEEKLQAEQESQRMEFILTREKQEAERKRIEAQGIADFQNIVAKGISDQLLRWKGIEATEKLANSQNSKIIVIGSGKDGLPIILGSDK